MIRTTNFLEQALAAEELLRHMPETLPAGMFRDCTGNVMRTVLFHGALSTRPVVATPIHDAIHYAVQPRPGERAQDWGGDVLHVYMEER